jgi:hypothetical protein
MLGRAPSLFADLVSSVVRQAGTSRPQPTGEWDEAQRQLRQAATAVGIELAALGGGAANTT